MQNCHAVNLIINHRARLCCHVNRRMVARCRLC